jgi:hypothetical protein
MSTYSITDRTDRDDVSVVTVEEQLTDSFHRPIGRPRLWTIVSHANGWDLLIKPNGDHVDAFEPVGAIPIQRLLGWVADNV